MAQSSPRSTRGPEQRRKEDEEAAAQGGTQGPRIMPPALAGSSTTGQAGSAPAGVPWGSGHTARWELDPTWQVMRVLSKFKLIEVTSPQRAVWPLPHGAPAGAETA